MTNATDRYFSPMEAMRFGWDKATASWKTLIWISGTGALLSLFQNPQGHPPGAVASLAGLVAHVGQVAVLLVLMRTAILLHDEKPVPEFNLRASLAGFFPFLLTYVLCGLIVGAGMVLLIVPGVLWGLRFGLAPLLVAEQTLLATPAQPPLDPLAALRASARLTEGSRAQLFNFALLCLGVNLLGLLAFGVGVLITGPMTCIAAVHVLRRLQARAPASIEATPPPASGPLAIHDPAAQH